MKDVYPVRRVQEFAAEKTMVDGLTDEGELNIRPCMTWDYFPRPFPTEEGQLMSRQYDDDIAFSMQLRKRQIMERNRQISQKVPISFVEELTTSSRFLLGMIFTVCHFGLSLSH